MKNGNVVRVKKFEVRSGYPRSRKSSALKRPPRLNPECRIRARERPHLALPPRLFSPLLFISEQFYASRTAIISSASII